METESDWNFADKKAFESTFTSELDAFSEFVKKKKVFFKKKKPFHKLNNTSI
jgi:hypothetical protein